MAKWESENVGNEEEGGEQIEQLFIDIIETTGQLNPTLKHYTQ